VSRHCAFSPDVTAGQSNVILPVRMISSTREGGSKHISDAAVAVVLAIVACQGGGLSSAVAHTETIPENAMDFPATNS